MTVVGDLERLFAALYPYRFPLAILVLVVAAIVLRTAIRRDWFAPARRHPRLAAAVVGVGLIVALPVGNYLLSPLWTTVELTEASPLDTSSAGSAAVVADGQFVGADEFHFGEGAVKIVETAPDQHTLRFEDFSVRNGPDLYVYLSPSADGYADGALELGLLKATDGSFNYELPAGVDPTDYGSVVIWCKQFAVLFATAAL
jgi:hypothetical protein